MTNFCPICGEIGADNDDDENFPHHEDCSPNNYGRAFEFLMGKFGQLSDLKRYRIIVGTSFWLIDVYQEAINLARFDQKMCTGIFKSIRIGQLNSRIHGYEDVIVNVYRILESLNKKTIIEAFSEQEANEFDNILKQKNKVLEDVLNGPIKMPAGKSMQNALTSDKVDVQITCDYQLYDAIKYSEELNAFFKINN